MQNLGGVFNPGKELRAALRGVDDTVFNASSTAGGVDVIGYQYDRLALTQRYRAAVLVVGLSSSQLLASGSGSVIARVQHSSDASSWDNLTSGEAVKVTNSATSGPAASKGAGSVNVPLTQARRHIRSVYQPSSTVTSSGPDAFHFTADFLLFGAEALPTTS